MFKEPSYFKRIFLEEILFIWKRILPKKILLVFVNSKKVFKFQYDQKGISTKKSPSRDISTPLLALTPFSLFSISSCSSLLLQQSHCSISQVIAESRKRVSLMRLWLWFVVVVMLKGLVQWLGCVVFAWRILRREKWCFLQASWAEKMGWEETRGLFGLEDYMMKVFGCTWEVRRDKIGV